MRNLATALVVALVWGAWAVSPSSAADLGTYPTYDCVPGKPSHMGVFEPYSRHDENPPRQGMWYYTNPQPPAVNFLVPMNGNFCARPEPWTPAWYDYCSRRWPSFNPNTGTIRTPDGVRMCI